MATTSATDERAAAQVAAPMREGRPPRRPLVREAPCGRGSREAARSDDTDSPACVKAGPRFDSSVLRGYCVECIGERHVSACDGDGICALWSFREGGTGHAEPMLLRALRDQCLYCANGQGDTVRDCPEASCALWPWRSGEAIGEAPPEGVPTATADLPPREELDDADPDEPTGPQVERASFIRPQQQRPETRDEYAARAERECRAADVAAVRTCPRCEDLPLLPGAKLCPWCRRASRKDTMRRAQAKRRRRGA